jgi:hypothetical protein
MKVGVLELISFTVPPEWRPQWIASRLRRHLYSVMPQVVAAWARRQGHQVHYATYYGQADPLSLLPNDLDVVIISSATQASALAYALAKCYRQRGTRTVLGGPHGKCFPTDSLRYFDIVVNGPCDQTLVADLIGGHIDPGSVVASERRPTDFPPVEERLADVKTASFTHGKPKGLHAFALLSSVGCPYTCNFCTEWNVPYAPLDQDRLTADLRFISKNYPRAVVAYHDPNFAVRFDQTMDAIEAAGPPFPRYVMNCSLSVLREDRLNRLRKTNCVFVAPGVESWYDYGNKAAAGEKHGRDKLEYVVDKFQEIRRHVSGLQANFLFGTDHDHGNEPADLTVEFLRRLPFLWPNVNTPTPYGGTPLFDQYLAEGRVLRQLPLAFYCAPYLATTLKNYDPPAYYRQLLKIHGAATDNRAMLRRVGARNPLGIRLAHLSQTLSYRTQLGEMRLVLKLLETDQQFRAFHDNRPVPLPEFYHQRFEHRLGRYAELIGRAERTPVLDGVA